MFEWLAAAADAASFGTSAPGMVQRIREKMRLKPAEVKERLYMSADIQCVAAAVAAREAALAAGAKTHGEAVASAYGARATALGGAYAATSTPAIRQGVKKAWESFNTAIRAARKNWQTARDKAWVDFRAAVKACKAPGEVVDSSNASSEPKGE